MKATVCAVLLAVVSLGSLAGVPANACVAAPLVAPDCYTSEGGYFWAGDRYVYWCNVGWETAGTGGTLTCNIVFPDEAGMSPGAVSVAANSFGTAYFYYPVEPASAWGWSLALNDPPNVFTVSAIRDANNTVIASATCSTSGWGTNPILPGGSGD